MKLSPIVLTACPLSIAVSFYGMSKISKRKLSQGFWASPEMPFWELVPLVKWTLKAHCEGYIQISAGQIIDLLNMFVLLYT